ncbi:MAG: hypothetical protein U1F98_17440 [Verrucomicrobiota bacterium]
MRPEPTRLGLFRGLLLLLLLVAAAPTGHAQGSARTRVNDFAVPENYPPPHETQLKSLLKGKQAEPLEDGRILILSAELQTFSETGVRQMLVEAPNCVFDPAKKTVSSAGPLSVRYGDGQFRLEGEGFLYQEDGLIVSNQVHTSIRNVRNIPLKP